MSDATTHLRAIADELRKEHAEGYLCIFCFDGQIMAKCIADAADEILRLRDENVALRAAVERVRALHQRAVVVRELYGPANWCSRCGSSFPCSTLRALEETP